MDGNTINMCYKKMIWHNAMPVDLLEVCTESQILTWISFAACSWSLKVQGEDPENIWWREEGEAPKYDSENTNIFFVWAIALASWKTFHIY